MTKRTWIALGSMGLLTLIVIGWFASRSPEPASVQESIIEEPIAPQEVEGEEAPAEFQDNLDDAFTDLELIES